MRAGRRSNSARSMRVSFPRGHGCCCMARSPQRLPGVAMQLVRLLGIRGNPCTVDRGQYPLSFARFTAPAAFSSAELRRFRWCCPILDICKKRDATQDRRNFGGCLISAWRLQGSNQPIRAGSASATRGAQHCNPPAGRSAGGTIRRCRHTSGVIELSVLMTCGLHDDTPS